jgi:two-component system LytT family response regulator
MNAKGPNHAVASGDPESLRVGVIDDEPLARTGLRRALAAMPGVEVVGEAGSVREAARVIEEKRPQAIFLDIQMPGATGFDLLRRLDTAPLVVFVTAHSGHAVRAFEVDAVDYVLKPVEPGRLAKAVARLRSAVAGSENTLVPLEPDDRLCLRAPERTFVTRIEDIVCLRADGDFCRFTLAGGETPFICRPLGSFLETLPNPPILRLDRSLAVNTRRIRRLERAGGHTSKLWLEGLVDPVPLGRAATLRIRAFMAGG